MGDRLPAVRPDVADRTAALTARAGKRSHQNRPPLRALQAEYEVWRDELPETLADSRTAEPIEGGLRARPRHPLDLDLPRGFGRRLTGPASR